MRRLETLVLAGCLLVSVLTGCSKSKGGAATDASAKAATSGAAAAPAPLDAGAAPLKSCAECESTSACAELMNPCQKFSGDDAKQCEAVKECVQRTGCGQGDHTFTSCYCGELGTAKCLAAPLTGNGAPKGACRDVLAAAYAAPKSNTELLTRYIEADYPGGAALARLNCLKLNCNRECSFNKSTPAVPGAAAPK
jgi:hypothetical protein